MMNLMNHIIIIKRLRIYTKVDNERLKTLHKCSLMLCEYILS